jgi:hypothetical protein
MDGGPLAGLRCAMERSPAMRAHRSRHLPLVPIVALAVGMLGVPAGVATAASTCTGWELVPLPGIIGDLETTSLQSVALTGAQDGWAVGGHSDGGVIRTLTVRVVDGDWSVVPSPNVDVSTTLKDNQLRAVATAGSAAFAVGQRTYHGEEQSLAMRWTGTEWVVTPSPRPAGTVSSILLDVTAVSPSDAWAVGTFDASDTPDPFGSFALHWNGTSWKVFRMPLPAGYADLRLSGVSSSGPDRVWVAGEIWDGAIMRPAFFRWNGTSWRWVASPPATQSEVDIGAVSVWGSDVWAVGSRRDDGISSTRPFAMHRSGGSWQVSAIAPSSDGWHWLTGVARTQDGRVWSAGTFQAADPDVDPRPVPLLERWNGTGWSSVTLDPADVGRSLSDVSAAGNDAIAVGPGVAYRRVCS